MKPYVTPQELVSLLQAAPWNAFSVEEGRKRGHSGTFVKKTSGVDPALYLIGQLHGIRNVDALAGMLDIYTGGRVLHRHPEKLITAGNVFGAISAFYDNARFSGQTKEASLIELCKWIMTALPARTALIDFNYDADPAGSVRRKRELDTDNPIVNFFSDSCYTMYKRNGHRVFCSTANS